MSTSNTKAQISSLFSNWETEVAKEATKTIETHHDPLTIVCSLLRSGVQSFDVINYLKEPTYYSEYIELRLEDRDFEQAYEIRDYFSKKHMLRRIKGDFISPWMNKVDKLCEASRKLNVDLLPTLVTLPRYYEDNRFIEGLMKESVSVPSKKNVKPFEEVVTFVAKHYRKTRNSSVFDYYWRTGKNELVRARIPTYDLSYKAWDFVAKQGQVVMNFKTPHVMHLQGYNFNVHCANSDTEINNYE